MSDGLSALSGRVGTFSVGIARLPHLRALLGAERIVFAPGPLRGVDCVVGWGRKPNTELARRHAARVGVPFVSLEDGFLRSVRPGVAGEPPLSIVADDLGTYYDAGRPSRLRAILAQGDLAPLDERATLAIASIRRHGLSKYNDGPKLALGPKDRPRVLVVDQTRGDLSIATGGAGASSFDRMLEAAITENPGAEIVVKTHPDVLLGKKAGHYSPSRLPPGVRLVARSASPASLFEQVDRVYVVTSLVGLEALLFGKPVTCFGAPFYAGWGATDDRATSPRGRTLAPERIFAAAYLRYARYVDPETGRACEAERVIEHLGVQRAMHDATAGELHCVEFSAWRRGFAPRFLASPRATVRFVRKDDAARVARTKDATLVVWASREDEVLRDVDPATRAARLWRMEDGFLRSSGLGSDLATPASLVVDPLGIYYDPTRPSELERILSETTFDAAELERAARLRARIVAMGVSKYDVGRRARVGPPPESGREVVLVVGQVEDDASIRLGCVDVRTNTELLERARAARPDAYLLWKPHPDVVSGNRKGAVPESIVARCADESVPDASLADCLAAASEVHVMTSLVGFEALLRERRVVVYGLPFYAGWGLTEDAHPHPRRGRALVLDELVAGALLRYPRYVSRVTGAYTTPEVVIDQIVGARGDRNGTPWRAKWPVRKLRQLRQLVEGILGVAG